MGTNGKSDGPVEGSLLKNILTIADSENTEITLVDMYRDLLFIAERLKSGIKAGVERDAKLAMDKIENEEDEKDEEEEEESDHDEEESDDRDSNGDSDEETAKLKGKTKPKTPSSDIEQLLDILSLDTKQKQHLLIKKAVLLKFEEALFGNNNITMTLDLRNVGENGEDKRLEEILQCKDLTKYIPKMETENGNSLEFAEKARFHECVHDATNPTDILRALRPKTPKRIATNLIKQQYNIRWNTQTGEAKPFDFFQLEKHFRKGIVRKTYVQTLLYEHKVNLANLKDRLNKSDQVLQKEDFVPKYVYGKKDPYAVKSSGDSEEAHPPLIRARDDPKFKWQQWSLATNKHVEMGPEFPSELRWIEPKVKTLLRKLCEPLSDEFNTTSTTNVMYLVVIKETTSEKLPEIGSQSQVYIAPADEGLKHRFLDADDSHSTKIISSLNEILEMEAFKPSATSLLIELRLLLAIARQEPYALFALNVFDDPRAVGKEVHDLVVKALYLDNDEIWGPSVNMKFGLNVKEEMKKRKKFLPDHFPGSKRKHK